MSPALLGTRTSSGPLYAAGFVTAFGAHSVAAGMGAQSGNIGLTLLSLGVLLAAYDISEVFLKPVFGALSDRIGTKPVIIGGLLAFAVLSLPGLWGGDPLMLGLARLGQGAAASAFPRRRRPWSRGWPEEKTPAPTSAGTDPGRASATSSGPCSGRG